MIGKILVIDGEKYEVKPISPCEGCHFHKPHFDGECSMPEEIDLDCGFETVYKKADEDA